MLADTLARIWAAPKPIKLASVAGILDKAGGVRVVASDSFTFDAHLVEDRDERYYEAPGVYVQANPIDWKLIPWVIAKGERTIEVSHMGNACGTCRACCIVLPWQEGLTNKPAHTPCTKLCHDGCGIYSMRPTTCEGFKCIWLASQSGNDPMPAELRPDVCGAILTPNTLKAEPEQRIEVHTYNERWKTSTVLGSWMQGQKDMGRFFDEVTHYDVVPT